MKTFYGDLNIFNEKLNDRLTKKTKLEKIFNNGDLEELKKELVRYSKIVFDYRDEEKNIRKMLFFDKGKYFGIVMKNGEVEKSFITINKITEENILLKFIH